MTVTCMPPVKGTSATDRPLVIAGPSSVSMSETSSSTAAASAGSTVSATGATVLAS